MKEKGDTPSETTRLVMRRIATQVWSVMSYKGLRGKVPISAIPTVARILKGVFLTDIAYNPFNIDADHDPGRLRIYFILMRIWIPDPHRIK